ncbi:hypothetical protein [Vibrio gallaecicus]|nr:hypothetical protein [Vibrio gallaecicus]MDN3615052.1 hypothetical protein [Vibrio gallaecicus]
MSQRRSKTLFTRCLENKASDLLTEGRAILTNAYLPDKWNLPKISL